jgi:hypothetical protein
LKRSVEVSVKTPVTRSIPSATDRAEEGNR